GLRPFALLEPGHDVDRRLHIDLVEELVVHRHHRAVVTGGQALGVLQGDLPVGGRLVVAGLQVLRQQVVHVAAAEHVAHRVRAYGDQPVTGRAMLVHCVEGRDRADLGPGQPQRLGAERDALGRDVALLGLDQVQQRQQRRAGLPLGVARDDLLRAQCKLLGERHQRSHPPMTGSSEAPPAMTSAMSPPSAMAGIACRLTKLGSRKCTRYGRVPPSETACAASSPRGPSMATYTWPGGTRKPSVTSLKWWMSDSIDWPMIFATCSSELPSPSAPMASWAGQAIFLSATITGPGRSLSRHCSMIFSDSRISATRTSYRPHTSPVCAVHTSNS